MEKHYVKFFVHLDLPDGEAPGIDAEDKASEKIKKALDIVMASGLAEYDFTAEEMDMADDAVTGLVLTHGDA